MKPPAKSKKKKQGSRKADVLAYLYPKINISLRQNDLPLSRLSIQKATLALCSFLEIACEEISLFFVTEKKISSLHEKFFDDPSPTDCITLPLDKAYLGDLFICPKTAVDYAKKHSLDPYEETLLYLTHGILHLIGYKDEEPNSRRIMRKMEKKCMEHLNQHHITLASGSR